MTTDDDLAFVRDRLGPVNPVPHASVGAGDLGAARADLDARREQPALARALLEDAGADRTRRRSPWLIALPIGAVAALVVAVLLALPSGKGGGPTKVVVGGPTGPAAQTVLASYDATKATGTAHASFSITATNSTTVSGDGVGDFATGDGSGTITFPYSSTGAADTVPVVSVGNVVYVKLGRVFPGSVAAGKPWIKLDRAQVTKLTGNVGGGFGADQQVGPTDALAYLKGVSGEVKTVGPDTVRGDATTHYTAAIDLNKVAAQSTGPAKERFAQAAASANQAIPADLWVDAQGRLRKLVLNLDLSKTKVQLGKDQSVPTGTATATFELWDFGAKVDAAAPPADQVGDLGPLLSGLIQGRAGQPGAAPTTKHP